MTFIIRESKNFLFFEELNNGYTAIMSRYTSDLSDWKTGEKAQEEKKYLICCENEDFEKYCKQVFK